MSHLTLVIALAFISLNAAFAVYFVIYRSAKLVTQSVKIFMVLYTGILLDHTQLLAIFSFVTMICKYRSYVTPIQLGN
jgi:hypothetical protein